MKKTCDRCGTQLLYNRKLKKWYCPSCMKGAYLTNLAQLASVKKYRASEKGRVASKRYEQSEKGKVARARYLKSEKYKAARKRYNERLKESLAIARKAFEGGHREKRLTREERLVPLIDDIREFTRTAKIRGHTILHPSPEDVITWAEDEYKVKITPNEAAEFIRRARLP